MTAPAELVIEVTADDIAKGIPCSLCLCPIALAVARLRGTSSSEVIVNTGTVSFPDYDADGEWVSYEIPDEAGQFVRDFDGGAPVAPFTFTARLWSAS